MLRKVVLVDGARTPFLKSFTDYGDMQGFELFRHAMLSTIDRYLNVLNNRKYAIIYGS